MRRFFERQVYRDSMHLNLLFLIFIFFSSQSFSTAQTPDKLIIDGETIALQSNPLEIYFKNNPDKKSDEWAFSTALWRGYIAVFKIENGHLIVSDIKVQLKKEEDHRKWFSVIDQVMTKEERVVSWYDGLLVAPRGEIVNYIHMGYASEFEKYTLFLIEGGKVIKRQSFSLEEYKVYKMKQFQKYKMTEEYTVKKNEYLEYAKKSSEEFDVDEFMFMFDDFAQKTYVEFE
jgi:hypothetical protein